MHYVVYGDVYALHIHKSWVKQQFIILNINDWNVLVLNADMQVKNTLLRLMTVNVGNVKKGE